MASFKDLCLDAHDASVVGQFWASALGLPFEAQDNGDAFMRGGPLDTLWVNQVPEPKATKNRVHLDLNGDVAQLLGLGAGVLAEHDGWTVLADPEGNEMCVLPGDAGGAPARPFGVCVDSAEPVELAAWWQRVLGGQLGPGLFDSRPRWLHGAAGMEDLIFKFVPVSDERVAKNRCHWDVVTSDVDALLNAGATMIRRSDDEIGWDVLTDPQRNEFCAFARPS